MGADKWLVTYYDFGLKSRVIECSFVSLQSMLYGWGIWDSQIIKIERLPEVQE